MDLLLGRLTQQAVNYAVKTGVTFAASYTIKQCGLLIQQSPKSQENEEMLKLQGQLENSTRIISPAIDMIELISARGNTTLEPAVALAKEIRKRIYALGFRIENATSSAGLTSGREKGEKTVEARKRLHAIIVAEMKGLILTMENAVPLINLAITTSGINLSTKLAATISPSRLVQASTLLTAADAAYMSQTGESTQVGPTFVVTLYMLFAGHAQASGTAREATWKEVLHKAQIKLIRVPEGDIEKCSSVTDDGENREIRSASAFAYQLVITEDLNDGRMHCDESLAETDPTAHKAQIGLTEVVPVQQLSKIFYADTGKILGIADDSETHSPVLLLKRDLSAKASKLHSQSGGSDDIGGATTKPAMARSTCGLPPDLDPEWMAFEAYTMLDDDDNSSSDDDLGTDSPSTSRQSSQAWLSSDLARMSLRAISSSPPSASRKVTKLELDTKLTTFAIDDLATNAVQTSLSLLEMLVKLTALQRFRQNSHLAIEDEFLNFFLADSSSIGLGSDENQRRQLRQQASKRVGFDPYDASPTKPQSNLASLGPALKTPPHGHVMMKRRSGNGSDETV